MYTRASSLSADGAGLNSPFPPPDKPIVNLNADTFRRVVEALSLAPADLRKRRSSRRMPLRAEVLLLRCDATDANAVGGQAPYALDATVTDASTRGIGFLCANPLEPGAQVLLHLPSTAGAPLSLRCDVIRCDSTPQGKYQIGARFAA